MRYLLQLVSGAALVGFALAHGSPCTAPALPAWPQLLALAGGGALLALGIQRLFGEGDRIEVEMEFRDALLEARRRLADAEREAADLATALAARDRQASNLIAELGALRARLGEPAHRAGR